MFCEKCGTENKDNAKFCEKCGTPIPEVPPTKTEPTNQSVAQIHKKQIIARSIILLVALACVTGFLVHSNSQKQAAYTGKLQTADKYLQELDYEHAEAVYLEAIDIQPKKEEAYIKLADVYVTQRKTDKAIRILENGKKKTGSETVETKLTELSAVEESGSEQYQAYYNLCMEYQKKYGMPGYKALGDELEDGTWNSWGVVGLTGLCVVELLDFNNDGNQELILGYESTVEGVLNVHEYEIWAWQENKLTNVLKVAECNHDQDSMEWIETTVYDGKIYLVQDTASLTFNYLSYDGKTFNKEIEIIDDFYINERKINGKSVSQEELNAFNKKLNRQVKAEVAWEASNTYFNENPKVVLPLRCVTEEIANQVLNESTKTLQSLND